MNRCPFFPNSSGDPISWKENALEMNEWVAQLTDVKPDGNEILWTLGERRVVWRRVMSKFSPAFNSSSSATDDVRIALLKEKMTNPDVHVLQGVWVRTELAKSDNNLDTSEDDDWIRVKIGDSLDTSDDDDVLATLTQPRCQIAKVDEFFRVHFESIDSC